tara:strand:- start:65 stop:250 length:186 start_codon:yes stop_codon:yes gene_type:complete
MKLRDVKIKCNYPKCENKVIVYLAGEHTGELYYYCSPHAMDHMKNKFSKKNIGGTLQNLIS